MQIAKIMSTTAHNLHQANLTLGSTIYPDSELKNKKKITIKTLVADNLEINILELK